MRPVKFYFNHPVIAVGLFIQLIHKKIFKNHIPKTKESDVLEINEYVNQFKKHNYFDFDQLLLTCNGFNHDLFFNVVYPHLQGISYSKAEIKELYKNVKIKWKSINFFSDNFLYLVNMNAIIAHGVTYFYNNCRVSPNDIVIDLGASPGDFAALAVYHGAKKVICFDPDKSSHLVETSKLNEGKIEIVPKYISNNNQYETISLDQFCIENSLTHLDFIKMDIEGAELLALKGAEKVIKQFHPKMSICVYHDLSHSKKLKAYIKKITPNYHFDSLGPVLYCTPKK